MVGLLVAGITAAKLKHPVWGVILCALAAAIKVPPGSGRLCRVGLAGHGPAPAPAAATVGHRRADRGAVLGALSMVSGLGWGWVANLATPGTVRSWVAPATGVGMAISGLAHAFGLNLSLGGVLSVTRVLGLAAAAAAAVYLLLVSDRIGTLKALGLSLLLFVVLGPVVQPWYLTWGLILLAPTATGKIRNLIIVLSIVSPFIGLRRQGAPVGPHPR